MIHQAFLSDLLRFRLNHFFLPDLSLPSTLPFSGLSGMLCSTVYLLLLLPAPTGFTKVRSVVNEQWILSLSLSISSTCRYCNSLATHINICSYQIQKGHNLSIVLRECYDKRLYQMSRTTFLSRYTPIFKVLQN